MSLSIVIPLDDADLSSATSEEDKPVSHEHLSHSPVSDVPSSSGTSPVKTSPTHHVSSRKPSSHSLAVFNRPAPLTPPVVHWDASSDSPSSSSSTLVESPQEERSNANATLGGRLRFHKQTCLDENKLANRNVTLDSAVSYCAALKGFQVNSGSPLDGPLHQLLTHATMLDFALGESNHEGLTHILQGLDRGVEEFLDSLDELPFDLRNTQSLISGTSDILEAKSALLGVASQLTQKADDKRSNRSVRRCHHERDALLRAIRVFLDIVDFESRLQAKLSIEGPSLHLLYCVSSQLMANFYDQRAVAPHPVTPHPLLKRDSDLDVPHFLASSLMPRAAQSLPTCHRYPPVRPSPSPRTRTKKRTSTVSMLPWPLTSFLWRRPKSTGVSECQRLLATPRIFSCLTRSAPCKERVWRHWYTS